MIQLDQKIKRILAFWFGHVEETILPSEHRARIWFGNSASIDAQIKKEFTPFLQQALQGRDADWTKTAPGCLALIILYDQFSRHIYRDKAQAYQQDERALWVCQEGMKNRVDHALSLIERVFFYFPLLHSEQLADQKQAIQAYHALLEMALPETRFIYNSFLKFANQHYLVIERFGRFPQRNMALDRKSSSEELAFLKKNKR